MTKKQQKLWGVMNGVSLAHNAFVDLKREDYPYIPDKVWHRISTSIRNLSGKLEIFCLWHPPDIKIFETEEEAEKVSKAKIEPLVENQWAQDESQNWRTPDDPDDKDE